MLFISHDLAVVAQACDQPGDQIAVMQHGQIVERAATLDLFRKPAASLYAAAAGVRAHHGHRPDQAAGVARDGREGHAGQCDKLEFRASMHG